MNQKIAGIKNAVKDVGTRVILKLIVFTIKHANKDLKIGELQKRYNAYEAATIKVSLTDKNISFAFRISDGKLKYVEAPEKVDGELIMTSDTFISLLAGKRKKTNPATGETTITNYTVQDAWFQGDLTTYGPGATNSTYLFMRDIWQEIQDSIQAKLGQKIASILQKE